MAEFNPFGAKASTFLKCGHNGEKSSLLSSFNLATSNYYSSIIFIEILSHASYKYEGWTHSIGNLGQCLGDRRALLGFLRTEWIL